jgi:hypothetical protein
MLFGVSGSTRLAITSAGNVGIGTSSPLGKLTISGGTVDTTTYTSSEARIADGTLHLMKTSAGGIFEAIRAINSDTTAGTTVRLLAASTSDPFNNANGGKVFIDAIRTSTNMDLAFSLNNVSGAAAVERMRIMGSGNVGIGTSTPVGFASDDLVFQLYNSASGASASRSMIRLTNSVSGATFNNGALLSIDGALDFYIANQEVGNLILQTSNTDRVVITSTGVVRPGANGTQDLGTSSLRWATIYTSDLSLSNGIGNYTIVEGEEKLYLYNNKNNKVYSFVLQEEDPSTATPKKS